MPRQFDYTKVGTQGGLDYMDMFDSRINQK